MSMDDIRAAVAKSAIRRERRKANAEFQAQAESILTPGKRPNLEASGSNMGSIGLWQGGKRKTNPTPRKRKKSLFVRLRDALDRETRAYAALRDKDKGCRIRKARGCTGRSEVGYHIIPCGKWATRWDLGFMGIGNVVGSCHPCNAGENWHRLDYADHHKKIFGEEFYAALKARAAESVKYSTLDLECLLTLVRNMRGAL